MAEKKRDWYAFLGPGLITGASDDDPSGIATYSQVGAKFGLQMLWTMLFSYPLMAGIQLICAHIGRVTGHGIAGNMRRHYPKWLMASTIGLMVTANVINLGADIGAMGAAARLLLGGPSFLYAAFFTGLSGALLVLVPYRRYVFILRWLTLSLFAYVLTALVVHPDSGAALRSTLIPTLRFDTEYLLPVVAVLGTTISPYLFFWQASEEAEEVQVHRSERALKRHAEEAKLQIRRMSEDTFVGMFFSNAVAWFIILAAAETLHVHGITNIQSSAEAAEALRPIGGELAFALFAAGIIGTGMLALPVLAGSAAYALGEALRWRVGLENKPQRARGFYGIIVVSMLLGLFMNLLGVNPVQALIWAAVINGVAAGPIMIVAVLMASSRSVMGNLTIKSWLKCLGWAATAVMLVASGTMLATLGK